VRTENRRERTSDASTDPRLSTAGLTVWKWDRSWSVMFGWIDRENRNTSNQSGQTGCGIRFARALNMEQTDQSWAGREDVGWICLTPLCTTSLAGLSLWRWRHQVPPKHP